MVNTSGRQFFETGSKSSTPAAAADCGDSSEKKSKRSSEGDGAGEAPSALNSKQQGGKGRRKSALPQRYVAPPTPAKAKSSLLLRKLDGGAKRKLP